MKILVLRRKPINLYKELKQRQGARKELLYWLMKNPEQYPKYKEMDDEPLDFDAGMVEQYMAELIYNAEDGMELFDEVDVLYDELCCEDKAKWKNRLKAMEYLINEHQ